MLNIPYSETELNAIRIGDFELPLFEKTVDRRGYIYLVEDSAYPTFIKVGRTNDLKKRLQAYNSDRPFNSCRYTDISAAFTDVILAESMILEKLYEEIPPTTFKKEWFEAKHLDLIKEWVGVAEADLELLDVSNS